MAHEPWTEQRRIEGVNHDAEIAELLLKLGDLPKRGLSDADEDAERSRLRAARDRLEAMPSVPDH
jgi:hypothetical protein